MDKKEPIKNELNLLIQQFYDSDSNEGKIELSKKIWATLLSIQYSKGDKKNLERVLSIWIFDMQLYLDDNSDFNSIQIARNFDSAVKTVDTSLLED